MGSMSIDFNENRLGTTSIKMDTKLRFQESLTSTYFDSEMGAIHSQDRVAGASNCGRIERS